MICSSSRTWVYMSRKISCSPGNTKGGAGWRNSQSWFCVVLQACHAAASPSVRSASFMSSPGLFDLFVKSRSSRSVSEYQPRPFGLKLTLQESALRLEVAPHALDIILLPQEVKVIASNFAEIVSTQHGNIRPHRWQGVDPAYQSSNDKSLGRKTESCNFSALVMPQGAAPLFLNTPAMTPCLNVGRAARYRSTGNCIQSTLMVPVTIRILLSLSPSR